MDEALKRIVHDINTGWYLDNGGEERAVADVQQEITKAYRRGYRVGYSKGSKYYLKNLPARKVRNMCEVCGRLSAELTIKELEAEL